MKTTYIGIGAGLALMLSVSANAGEMKKESLPQAVSVKEKKLSTAVIDKPAQGITIKRHEPKQTKRIKTDAVQAKASKKLRAENVQKSMKASDFVIYDAWTYLDYDADFDGFYSEFTVNFDVDVVAGYADVFADIYVSRNGQPWEYLATTDTFTIFENNADDYYGITTRLNYGFPPGYYDVLIDVYESGYSGVVATADPNNFSDLYALPLEDQEHEIDPYATDITYMATDLYDDFDFDGYYSRIFFEFDVDTLDPGRLVYTEMKLTNRSTYERYTAETENFVLASQTEIVELILDVGYFTGWYDVELSLIDSVTGEVIEKASQEFYSLSDLPLESLDFNYDRVDEVIIIEEHGGGSFGWFLAFIVLLPLRKILQNQ